MGTHMANDPAILELLRADMERAERQMHEVLTREFFKHDPFYDRLPHPAPIPRWKRRWRAIRGYFVILWLALKGTDLVEPVDD